MKIDTLVNILILEANFHKVGTMDKWMAHFKEAIRLNTPKGRKWNYSLKCWRKYTSK